MKTDVEREYYLKTAAKIGWSRNVLLNQINPGAYQQTTMRKAIIHG